MLPLASYPLKVCAGALLALMPARTHDAALEHQAPAQAQAPLKRLQPATCAWDDVPYLAALRVPLLINPGLASWFARRDAKAAVTLELIRVDAFSVAGTEALYAQRAIAALRIDYAAPTLLSYTDEDTDVALSISPGSPCTGACLKLAGSF